LQFQLDAFRIANDELTNLIADYPSWLCDDDGREITDFIGLDEGARNSFLSMTRREGGIKVELALTSRANVASLQDEVRAALAPACVRLSGRALSPWIRKLPHLRDKLEVELSGEILAEGSNEEITFYGKSDCWNLKETDSGVAVMTKNSFRPNQLPKGAIATAPQFRED